MGYCLSPSKNVKPLLRSTERFRTNWAITRVPPCLLVQSAYRTQGTGPVHIWSTAGAACRPQYCQVKLHHCRPGSTPTKLVVFSCVKHRCKGFESCLPTFYTRFRSVLTRQASLNYLLRSLPSEPGITLLHRDQQHSIFPTL